ncbi:hypothetical protein EYF80_045443 [Liparis tanakae]|uniref:Uncharacterized protein n=1 Tax=Liparis tanakae TaxID=230148 RepID=A0A4Z2FSZ8_9TELE|nr:hypothetical protein EYF80_045443 [Liparis tanakae]
MSPGRSPNCDVTGEEPVWTCDVIVTACCWEHEMTKPPPPPLSTFNRRRLIGNRWRFMCRRLSTFTFAEECAAAASLRHAAHTRVTERRPAGFTPPGLEENT